MPKTKAENQILFITKLKEYCSYSEETKKYVNPVDFTYMTLGLMAETLMELKEQTISEARNNYFRALTEGSRCEKEERTLLEILDKAVPEKTFTKIKTAMNFRCKNTLVALLTEIAPLSIINEGRKAQTERDKAIESTISFVYRRLNFDCLEEEFKLVQTKTTGSVENVLAKARQNVKDYCAALHIPMNENDTLSPFMLSNAEAMIAANERLIKRLREIQFGI